MDFCINNVKHIAVECHLRASDDGHDKFIKFRNEFLKPFIDSGKFRMRFMNNNISEILWDDKRIRNTGGEFMIYLTKTNG